MGEKTKLDINKNPEAFSRVERAIHLNNLVATEIKEDYWKRELPLKREGNEFLGVDPLWMNPDDASFLEGFFAALAFCAGAASRGKVMEVCGKTAPYDVLHCALNTAKSAMECQTLWEQNEDSR